MEESTATELKFCMFEPYVITGEAGTFVITSSLNPHSQIQIPNTNFPSQFGSGGIAHWDYIMFNLNLCDWVTSFGALNNNLPTPPVINAYLRSIYVALP